jgi:hypothetical protein
MEQQLPATQADRYYDSLVDLVRRRLGVRWLLLQGGPSVAAWVEQALGPAVGQPSSAEARGARGRVVAALQRSGVATDARALLRETPELQGAAEEAEERDDATATYRRLVGAVERAAAREGLREATCGAASPLSGEVDRAWEASGCELGPFLRCACYSCLHIKRNECWL